MEFFDYLKLLVHKDGSDLYLTCGAPAAAKFEGHLKALEKDKLDPEKIKSIAYSIMNEQPRDSRTRADLSPLLATKGAGK